VVKKVINSGNWVSVPNFDLVQGSVINVESPSLVLLLHQYNQSSVGGGVGSDVPLLKKLLDMTPDFVILHR
jgi:hypothetical protein